MSDRNKNSLEDLDLVGKVFHRASRYNLEIEVILWSLYYMKKNPKATIEEALSAGLQEWDL